MKNVSQLEEMLDEVKAPKLKEVQRSRSADFERKITTPVDPAFYDVGGKRWYTGAGNNVSYMPVDKALEKMGGKASPFAKYRGMSLQKEAGYQQGQSFDARVNEYFGKNQELHAYLEKQGRSFYNLQGFAQDDLGDAIAGVGYDQQGNAVLLGNYDFEDKVAELAQRYGVPKDLAREYVFDHEYVHVAQKGNGYDDVVALESDVEHTLYHFYKEMAREYAGETRGQDYELLAGIAYDRATSVAQNYAGAEPSMN